MDRTTASSAVAERHGFLTKNRALVIHGLCPACQGKP